MDEVEHVLRNGKRRRTKTGDASSAVRGPRREGSEDVREDDASPIGLTRLWANLTDEPALVLWLVRDIDRPIVDQVAAQLARIEGRVPRLWLMLASGGGDLDAAYHVARIIQAKADEVVCVVPRWAKSAATLIAVGCNRIVMHPLAELGPLDAQVTVSRQKHVRFASTLDGIKSVEYLRSFAVDTFEKLTTLSMKRFRVDEQTAATMACGAMAAMVQPIFAQIEPGEMGEQNRLLNLSMEYGRRLMQKSYRSLDEQEREELLERLVTDYPSHSFVIDYEEALDLGLDVRLPEANELTILDRCSEYFLKCELHHREWIELVVPPTQQLPLPAVDGASLARRRSSTAR